MIAFGFLASGVLVAEEEADDIQSLEGSPRRPKRCAWMIPPRAEYRDRYGNYSISIPQCGGFRLALIQNEG